MRLATARRRAAGNLESARRVFEQGEDQAADDLVGTGAVLDALAATVDHTTRIELLHAARAFERVTRSHVRAENADRRALRTATRGIAIAGTARGRGEDGAAVAAIFSTLVLTVIAAARWHSAGGRPQQAAAARQSAAHLRAAYRQAAAIPMNTLRARASQLPTPVRTRLDATIRTALGATSPGTHAPAVWMPALAATLAEAPFSGHNADRLLRQAIDRRELHTADSVEDVLVWRIRRLAHLPAPSQNRRTASTALKAPEKPERLTRSPPTR